MGIFTLVFSFIFHERLHVLEILIYSNGITDCPFTNNTKNIMCATATKVQLAVNTTRLSNLQIRTHNVFTKRLFCKKKIYIYYNNNNNNKRNLCLFQLFNVSLSRVFHSVLIRFMITRLWTLFDTTTQSRRSAFLKIVLIPAEGFSWIGEDRYFKKLLQKNLSNLWFFVLKLYISNIYFYPLFKMKLWSTRIRKQNH